MEIKTLAQKLLCKIDAYWSTTNSRKPERLSRGETGQAVALVANDRGHKITSITKLSCRLLKENKHE
jgi:hypothetical protein